MATCGEPNSANTKTNPRGIPCATFVDDVVAVLGSPDKDVMPTLHGFQDAISKYKAMEMNITQRRKGLLQKIPDISKTLEMVQYLKKRKDDSEAIDTMFELNDTLYARASIEPVSRVHLWLGANVMLSYTLDEAIDLLTEKLQVARKNLQMTSEDLGFLRDQITTMEVNTARVHNWDVKRRRERKLSA
ncbi:hypothetical protein MVES1_003200 [Malassezia vespertilionis]|uniref:uncharacterized protein n=1 Tax=Malassezia vespertilionis TaxID=2020962 RepID=UPI0024B1E59A|nr:uncharacterized protein MVES1_003200 [Malassezia vespertilionis]WFD07829.1 hypothetical protein MVES1_003200 [Malassezia vespertilionis]